MSEPLWPREHGAYAQLAFPLVSGLLAGRPTISGAALALAAIGFFLAYEPASIVLGVRGSRARRTWAEAAVRRLNWLTPAGLILGAVGVATAPPGTRLVALIPVAIGLTMLPLFLRRSIKTLAGEILLAAACAGMHLPIAAAGGVRGATLWAPAALWFVVFLLAIVTVHAIKARQAGPGGDRLVRVLSDVFDAAALIAVVGLALRADSRWPALAALAPVAATAAVNFGRLPARRLKQVGWTVVAADLATLIVMTAWARTGS